MLLVDVQMHGPGFSQIHISLLEVRNRSRHLSQLSHCTERTVVLMSIRGLVVSPWMQTAFRMEASKETCKVLSQHRMATVGRGPNGCTNVSTSFKGR